MSPLLFSLYFDRVINFLGQHIPTSKAIRIINLVVRAALYADDVILFAPEPTSMQASVTCLVTFAATECLCISISKTIVLMGNYEATFQLQGIMKALSNFREALSQVEEARYLGLNLRTGCSCRQQALR